jgi:hypothetical protein
VLDVNSNRRITRHCHERNLMRVRHVELQTALTGQRRFSVAVESEPQIFWLFCKISRKYVTQKAATRDEMSLQSFKTKPPGPIEFCGLEDPSKPI